MDEKITIQDFGKVEIRVGLVTVAENVEGSEKLIRLHVDLGTEQRVIFTGVRTYGYAPEDFAGKKFLFVTNLEPKVMPYFAPDGATKGKREESQGMILAVDPPLPAASDGQVDEKPIFVSGEGMPVGAKVR